MLVPPSPKLHDQEVTLPVELSVRATGRGAVPERGVAVKLATGATAVAKMVLVAVLPPAEPVTVRVTV